MNYMTKTMVAAGMIMAVFAMPVSAHAEVKYGVVDINVIMNKSDAAKGLFNELQAKRDEYLAQLKKQDESFRSKEAAVMKEKDKLPKEELEKKADELRKMLTDIQKNAREREQTLNTAINKSQNKLREEIAKIVAKVAKDKGYDTVFTQEAVIIAAQGLDITDEVIERMNKEVKKVPADWSAPAKK